MEGRFSNHPFINEQEDIENSPENSEDTLRSGMLNDTKTTSTSSPKRRRAAQKRVVSIPIGDIEGSRLKGESAPPSDSWAWRKYGQKPIKGSPYPRGYYRCSSSKGCPARKQVERSHVDPTMVVVTYSCEHNHASPASKNNHHQNHQQPTIISATTPAAAEAATPVSPPLLFDNLGEEESQINAYQFEWFSHLESVSSTVLESPMLDSGGDGALIFTIREEDESLFGDLGELPECAVVFRRGVREREEEERRRCNLAPWCGTTGVPQLSVASIEES
ncbi:unnamed protein product [Camellia sinensis]